MEWGKPWGSGWGDVPPICWNFTARYKNSRRTFKVAGGGPFPKRLKVPRGLDLESSSMVDDGRVISSSDFMVEEI